MKNVGSAVPITVYPHLEQLLGYGGSRRFVVFISAGDSITYQDGETHGACPPHAWQAFSGHPRIMPLLEMSHVAEIDGGYCLLLDREKRQLFSFQKATAEMLLRSEKNREVPNGMRMLEKLQKLEGMFSLKGHPDIGDNKPDVGSTEHFTRWMITAGRDAIHNVK